jgi:hypothetical protein
LIHHAGTGDLLQIVLTRSRQQIVRLNPPYTIIQPEPLIPDLLKSLNPAEGRRLYTAVFREGGHVLAYVQARCRWQRRDEWTITTLGALVPESDHLWAMLLEEVIGQAGERGIVRIFAKLPTDDARQALFRQLGFTQFTHEEIWGHLYFKAAGGARPERGALRRQSSRDAWDLLQLYRAVAPRGVQQAEALTSKQWQLGNPWPGGLTAQAFVWDADNPQTRAAGIQSSGLGGWVRLLTGPKGHWITVMYRPEQRTLCTQALEYILWTARTSAPKPIYIALREYQGELAAILQDYGFHLLSEQALLVKYTAVLARRTVPSLLLNREPTLATSDWGTRVRGPAL